MVSPAAFMASRRRFLGGTLGGLFALACKWGRDDLFAAAPTGRAQRIVVLWMAGGPSQFETFDPKPGAETGGGASAIDTAAPGLQISSFLPEIAQRMDRLAVLRHVTSEEGEHERAEYYLHTGYRFVPSFPRPALGAVVSHEAPSGDLPNYVSLGARGFGPAFLGPDHAPFAIEDAAAARELLTALGRRSDRLELLQTLGAEFTAAQPSALVARRAAMVEKLRRLSGAGFNTALDVDRASEDDRARYGDSDFGRNCLVARRLLETGVRFVEIQHGGWDTHADNLSAVRNLCGEIDRPWAMLLDDLKANGLWDETIVVWMGEFGRTPQINGDNGRDHFPTVTPVVLGGGGLRGGQALGATNPSGTEIEGGKVGIPDLFASLLAPLGIDPAKEFTTEFNSPTPATEHGTPIAGLV